MRKKEAPALKATPQAAPLPEPAAQDAAEDDLSLIAEAPCDTITTVMNKNTVLLAEAAYPDQNEAAV